MLLYCFIKYIIFYILIIYNIILLVNFLFFCGLFVFFNYKYLLVRLLSLEYIILSLFIYLYLYIIFINYELFFRIIFLTFSVCEGVLGLSLLISIVRRYGNSYFQSINIFIC